MVNLSFWTRAGDKNKARAKRSKGERNLLFNDQAEWNAWRDNHAGVLTEAAIDAFGEKILASGFREPITRTQVDCGDIRRGTNWREGLSYKNVNSRGRAVLLVIERILGRRRRDLIPIFAAEAVTGFALRMRGVFPLFIGTEYAADQDAADSFFPIRNEDLTALTFPDGRFEIAITNEVLEHVPDLDASLRELARILMPGGWHISTFPFAFDRSFTMVRAVVKEGAVQHILPPEYHGNPVDPSGGSLVFQLPGWDILDRCRAAGFSTAEMRFIVSRRHGIVSPEVRGIFVLVCQK